MSAKGADARRQTTKELRQSFDGEPDTATVLRDSVKPAKGADARRQTTKVLRQPFDGEPDTATVLRDSVKPAKGADARRQTTKVLRQPFGGEPDTATVLRDSVKPAKGADARRQTTKVLRQSFGGEPDTATVLRDSVKPAKGADARRQTTKELRQSFGGEPDTATVSRAVPESPTNEIRAALVRKIASLIGSAEILATEIPGLTLHRRTAPTAQLSVTYEPSVAVVVQGQKRVDLGPKTFFYGESRFLLTSVDLPVTSQVTEASEQSPYLCLRLRLEIPVVRELMGREEIPVTYSPADGPAMATGETTAEFLAAFCRLLDLLQTPRDIPFLRSLIEREIIYRILCSAEGQRLRAIATLGDQSHRTAKAIAWIKQNYAKALKVEDLAEVAGMGVSTLHHHFRALTAMSPLQYQKQIRLHAARARMLVEGLDAASAAFEVGYESPSQFNREYSRFFGLPPMRDVRTLRSSHVVGQ